MRNRKFKKNSKKIQSIKRYRDGIISSKNRLEKAEKEKKIKIFFPFRSYPTGNRKFQKKRKKIKKYHCGFIPSQNRLEKAEELRK